MSTPPFDEAGSFTAHSRARFLAQAGAALGGAGLITLGRAESAVAAVPPTEYHARSYGAVGDGVTDDTAAIQAALDAAKNAGGGVVVLHVGTFSISRPLTVYSRVTLRGSGVRGTVLKKRAPGSFPAIKSFGFDALTGTDSDGGIHSWSLESLAIDGSRKQGVGGLGLQIYGHGYTIDDVAIFECGARGIWAEWNAEGVPADGVLEAFLTRVLVHDCSEGGVWWQGPHDSKWVDVTVYRCSPPGLTSGSTTVGVDVRRQSPGFRAVNCHVWGTHKYAWVLGGQLSGLVGCFGEGAERAQVLINDNMCDIVGGQYFGVWSGNDSVGFEIGTPERACAASYVNTLVANCNRGALHFVNDAGIGRYELFVWQQVGEVIVSPPAMAPRESNRIDIVYSGGARPGQFGSVKPFHFPGDVSARGSLHVRGDLQAGGATSKLGFFGAEPQQRGAEWTVAPARAKRALGADASLADVRAVLATLIGELQGFGLLAGQRAAEAPQGPDPDEPVVVQPPAPPPASPPPPAAAPPPSPPPPPGPELAQIVCPPTKATADRGPVVRAVRRLAGRQRPN